MNLVEHLHRQRSWSEKTFGPGDRTKGLLDHLRKELVEVEQQPDDLSEWVDVAILALDGAWRSGHTPEQIAAAIQDKQARNEQRSWPDWRTHPLDKAIEHIRTEVCEGGFSSRTPVEGRFFINIGPGGAIFVKEGMFFKEQGGLTEDWGRNWIMLEAEGLSHARMRGEQLCRSNRTDFIFWRRHDYLEEE